MATGEDHRRRVARRRGHARGTSPAWPTSSPRTSATASGWPASAYAGCNWRKQGPAPRTRAGRAAEVRRRRTCSRIASADLRVPFDPREVLARVLDGSEFDEFKPAYGTALVTGWGELHGYPVGVLANARGVLFSEEAQKAAQFIQLANAADTPLLFLQNTTGYMVGTEYEQRGIIKHGALMINAVSNSTVPHLTVNIGASYGAGNYGMCGRAYEPRFLFAWPNAQVGGDGPGPARRRAVDRGPAGGRGQGPALRRGRRRGDADDGRAADRDAVGRAVPLRPALRRRRDRPPRHPYRPRAVPVRRSTVDRSRAPTASASSGCREARRA